MIFRSTRDKMLKLKASEAIFRGLAPDGGLFVPEKFPAWSGEQKRGSAVALDILRPYFANDSSERRLKEICEAAFNFPFPLVETGPLKILELFHGPTAAFKDFGARFLAKFLESSGRPSIILVATSGDTGGAVAAAFDGAKNVDVVVLFPEKGVSNRQRHQLTCWGPNIHSVSVRASFDDCQALVKKAFGEWRGSRPLSSANSISLGRLLPQMFYFAETAMEYHQKHKVKPHFIIPTGNLGNAVACMWAREMGLPISKITLALNSNQTIADFFKSGKWEPRPSVRTLANAMDVGNPSNMERVFDLFPDPRAPTAALDAHWVSDRDIQETIKKAHSEWGALICPHTATAVHYFNKVKPRDTIVVATAHPAKFEEVIEPLIGEKIELPGSLRSIEGRKAKFTEIGGAYTELTTILDSIDIKE